MGHGITSTDRYAEVRSNGKRAWHGLGEEIPEGLSPSEAIERVAPWETDFAPVFTTYNGRQIAIPDRRAHIRTDTCDVLGEVSDGWQCVSNRDFGSFCDALVGEDRAASVETAFTIMAGRKVVALLRMPNDIEPAPGDVVKPYICVSNGHGGHGSFQGTSTTVRVVCKNTLALADREIRNGFRFFHTGDMTFKLEQARLLLGFAQKELAAFDAQAKAMARKNLSALQVRSFMSAAWEATFGKVPVNGDADTIAKLTARRDKAIETWLANMENERQQIPSIRSTVWAAMNAVTEWHEHERGRAEEGSDQKIHSNLFGHARLAKAKVLKTALSFV